QPDGPGFHPAAGGQRGGHGGRPASAKGGGGMTTDGEPDAGRPAGGSTSQSLLAEARRADPAAWKRLALLYAPLVAAWCRRWGVAEHDVVDVLQEVFWAVARHLESFRKEQAGDTFRGWLLTIARNKARDHFRRQAHEPAAAGGTE